MRAQIAPGIVSAGLAALLCVSTLAAADNDSQIRQTHPGEYVFHLLPKALQKNPPVDMTVITEATELGRKLGPASAGKPQYYLAGSGSYHDEGEGVQGERPIPVAQMEAKLEASLTESHYLRASREHPASIVLFFLWGSLNTLDDTAGPDDIGPQVIATPEMQRRNLVERAAIVGGEKFAHEYALALAHDDVARMSGGPGGMGPLQAFVNRDDLTGELVEQSLSDCYYVVASAYDAYALAHGKKALLWRTKMTAPSRGVAMEGALPLLVRAGGAYFGKPMEQAATLSGNVVPSGHVIMGEPVVVPDRSKANPQ